MRFNLKQIGRKVALAGVAAVALAAGAVNAADLNGGGASFPNPMYQQWLGAYKNVAPQANITYQSVGSGAGINGLLAGTFDFAGSDAPMKESELQKAGKPVVHIPTVAGSVVPAYNLPGFNGELKLDGPTFAQIMMGKIQRWNDPRIQRLNQGTQLPAAPITPVWRTDSSGTTFVFTNYLSEVSDDFKNNVGAGKAVKWPAGVGGKGNEGVAGNINNTPGAIGYIELDYAQQNNIPFAAVKNQAGNFVKASAETVSAAGAGAVEQMEVGDLAVDIWNQKGDNAYPIAAYTYIIVYKDLNYLSRDEAQALVEFLNWAVTDGQQLVGQGNNYAPLAQEVRDLAQQTIDQLQYGGQPLNANAAAN